MDTPITADPPVHERKTLLELGDEDCRYPLGHVGLADFGFCGRPKHTGPYCEAHARRCFLRRVDPALLPRRY